MSKLTTVLLYQVDICRIFTSWGAGLMVPLSYNVPKQPESGMWQSTAESFPWLSLCVPMQKSFSAGSWEVSRYWVIKTRDSRVQITMKQSCLHNCTMFHQVLPSGKDIFFYSTRQNYIPNTPQFTNYVHLKKWKKFFISHCACTNKV